MSDFKIVYFMDTQVYRVIDPITEGWIDVPLDMVADEMGRAVFRPTHFTPRSEILRCARKLLLLLLNGDRRINHKDIPGGIT